MHIALCEISFSKIQWNCTKSSTIAIVSAVCAKDNFLKIENFLKIVNFLKRVILHKGTTVVGLCLTKTTVANLSMESHSSEKSSLRST